jgi:hypothetical protein
MYDLKKHIERAIVFSKETYGPGHRSEAICKHIEKEVNEIREKPHDLEEWIDIIILGIDGAWRSVKAPLSRGEIATMIAGCLEAKQTKNERRQWPNWRDVPADSPIEHVRTEESR